MAVVSESLPTMRMADEPEEGDGKLGLGFEAGEAFTAPVMQFVFKYLRKTRRRNENADHWLFPGSFGPKWRRFFPVTPRIVR